MTSQKPFFWWKTPKIYTWPDSACIFFYQSWHMTTKQGMARSDMLNHVIFLYLFNSPESHITPNTTKTGKKEEYRAACLNADGKYELR